MKNTRIHWFKDRFVERSSAQSMRCCVCGVKYWMPQSKAAKYITCGPDCAMKRRVNLKEERRRLCATCGKEFYPRTTQISAGVGTFCSQACNSTSHAALRAPEARAKSEASFKISLAAGCVRLMKGPLNGMWRGGREEVMRRYVESGSSAASSRRYRENNPESHREKSQRRRGRKTGRLERGTVKRIGEYQKWLCAICHKSVRKSYHVDHIMPLALGGEHAGHNIQILCPTCNLKKSAKHPIAYMQERGFLI